MYKSGNIQTTVMFFLIGVLMWLLYGGHYEEVAFAQGGEVEPTLAAEAEPTAMAEAELSEMPSETAVEEASSSSSQASEPILASDDAEKWANTASELIEAVDGLLSASEQLPEAAPESTEVAPESSESTDAVEESSESAQESTVARATSGDMACFGTIGFGVTCLHHASRERAVSGWTSFNEYNSSLADDWIWNMAVCPDNRIVVAHSLSVSAFDGQKWVSYGQEADFYFADGIACDANGGIWVAHFEGVSYFDGQSWTTTPSKQLATGDDATDLVEHVAIAPDGQVWVASAHTIATTKDGSEWTVYQQGQGFNQQYFFDALAIDNQGGVWAAHSRGLLHFDGTNWTTHKKSTYLFANDIVVDNDGNVWLGTSADGLMVFDGQNWVTYNTQNSGLMSNSVQTLAIDAQGRIWVGTQWGVTVIDGNNWTTYQMDNAELADNDISALAVIGSGPPLPQAIDKENGELSGQLLNSDAEPIANTRVELCVGWLSSFFTNSPCEEQPFILQTTTDANGNFTIRDVPVGRYVMTANIGEDEWAALENEIGVIEERILVNAGEETDLSTLILQQGEFDWYFRRK